MTTPNLITDVADAIDFMMGGSARFTIVSKKTGTRYTYRFRRPSAEKPMFVQLLTGPDNVADYTYLGYISQQQPSWVQAGHKGSPNHPAFTAIHWLMAQLAKGEMPEQVEVWHEGRCGSCGRVLTDPASIERGFGPECASK